VALGIYHILHGVQHRHEEVPEGLLEAEIELILIAE
jgi:hypothetical protein